jgi:nicotinate dehydrogenase subunit A
VVLVDAEPVYARSREISAVAGRHVTTIEGLAQDDVLHPLQQAFLAEAPGRCW